VVRSRLRPRRRGKYEWMEVRVSANVPDYSEYVLFELTEYNSLVRRLKGELEIAESLNEMSKDEVVREEMSRVLRRIRRLLEELAV